GVFPSVVPVTYRRSRPAVFSIVSGSEVRFASHSAANLSKVICPAFGSIYDPLSMSPSISLRLLLASVHSAKDSLLGCLSRSRQRSGQRLPFPSRSVLTLSTTLPSLSLISFHHRSSMLATVTPGDVVDGLGQQRVKAARSVGAAAAVEQRDRVGVECGGERDQVVYVDRSAAVLDRGDDVDRQRAPGVLEAGGERSEEHTSELQ